MDEKSEAIKNLTPESSNPVPNPSPKKSTKKKVLITVAIILGVLLLLIGALFIAANIYLDNMLDYISYETDSDYTWDGTDIDASDYGIDDDGLLGEYSGGEFSDPDLSREDISNPDISLPDDSNGESSRDNYVPNVSYEQYEPDYEIISGVFDDNIITEADEKDVVNILLIGADTLSGKSARSDTMILMSINNNKKRIVFTSFMRDTYVAIPGHNNNRLNAAYAAGGPKLLMQTIKYNFDITIDYYFTVSIASFESAVDVIGGIDITVNSNNYTYFKNFKDIRNLSEAEATDGSHVIHLNGGQALVYARSRAYSNGDFTRTLHQRDLLTQFFNSCKGASLEEMHNLLKSVLPYVSTNMPKGILKSYVWNVLTYLSYNVTDARVPCPGSFEYANIGGREVLKVDINKNIAYLRAKIYG